MPTKTPTLRAGTLTPLFENIVEHVPPPAADFDGPFKFLVTLLDRDNFLGRILTGRVQSGTVKVNSPIHALDNDGKVVETGRASKLMAFRGLERVPVDEARAGDIISIAGLTQATVANTIADPTRHRAAPRPADRSADAVDALCGERQPDGGPRRHQGDQPHDPRPPGPRRRKATSRSRSPNPPTRTASKSPVAANSSSAC